MNKQQLQKSLAQTAYNIGFGAKKHFVSYDLYNNLPLILSVSVIIVAIFQLTPIYNKIILGDWQVIVPVILIAIGFIGIITDCKAKDKENINKTGKELIKYFNRLRNMYNEVSSLPEDGDFQKYMDELNEIESTYPNISISNLAIGTHIIANLKFFGGETQIDWIDKELNFKLKDKFPFWHIEAIILYVLILTLSIFIIYSLIK